MSDTTSQVALSINNEPRSPAQPENLSPDQQEFSEIPRSIRLARTGGIPLGKDGVLRSLTADQDIIGAVALPPRLIKAHLDRLPYYMEVQDEFRDVDGTKTPREQWFHPNRSLLLEPLSEEHKEEARKMIEEHALLDGERRLKERQGGSCCSPVVRSNYADCTRFEFPFGSCLGWQLISGTISPYFRATSGAVHSCPAQS